MQCKFCGYENSLISQSEDPKCFQCGAQINRSDKSMGTSSINQLHPTIVGVSNSITHSTND